MFYIKNGILRESKKPLETADGRTIYNAPLEMWEAEGWEIYDPEVVAMQQQEQAVEEEIQEQEDLDEVRQDVLQECEDFYNSLILKFSYQGEFMWISANDRVKYLRILEDAQEEGLTQVSFNNFNLTVEAAISYLKAMNVYEFKCRCVYEEHRQIIDGFTAVSELELYDYTSNYPEPLVLE